MLRRIAEALTSWRAVGTVFAVLLVAGAGFSTARVIAGAGAAPASAAIAYTDTTSTGTTTSPDEAYSAEEALRAEGYVWDDSAGFFVGSDAIADTCATSVYTSACPDSGVTDTCTTTTVYTSACSDGGGADTPKPRLDPNGCGPGWLPSEVTGAGDHPGGFDFKAACDAHDKCYSTYPIPKDYTGATWKAKCDNDFDAALKKYCDSVQGAKIADKYNFVWDKEKGPRWEKTGEIKWDDKAAQSHCNFWRDTYVTAVKSKLGDAAFQKAQDAAKKAAEGDGQPTDTTSTTETSTTTAPSTDTTYTTTPSPTTPYTDTTYSTTVTAASP